jgi:hypothetical protein
VKGYRKIKHMRQRERKKYIHHTKEKNNNTAREKPKFVLSQGAS